MRKKPMRSNQVLDCRAMGISNACYGKPREIKSVQFYDYDLNGLSEIPAKHLERIMEIFPYDCLIYETKHGLHFISFALLYGLKITKARTIKTTKEIGNNQDYWTTARDLTLRISPKWKLKKYSKKRLNISNKPKFLGLLSSPNQYRISKKHLEFYFKFMGLPEEIYNLYQDCKQENLKIKIYHYKTRD